jgi:acetyl-CoA C-acetyltransferase
MENIKDKVAVIGMGCSKFGAEYGMSPEDLMIAACGEALEDAGVEPKDIDGAWFGTFRSGGTGQTLARAIKLQYIPIARIEDECTTGTETFRGGVYGIITKVYDIVLVCAMEKESDYGEWAVGVDVDQTSGTRVSVPVSAAGSLALTATRYLYKYGLSLEQGKELLARIVVKNRRNGSLNSKAYLQEAVTLEDVISAPMVAWPLGELDYAKHADGAAAAVLVAADRAKNFRHKDDYVLAKAIGGAVGSGQGKTKPSYDFIHFEEAVAAAKQAYEGAGIRDPLKEVSVAMVHDSTSLTELVAYEDLGFAPRGGAKELVKAGAFELGGQLPVNTDGGLLAFGHPTGATGMRQIYEAYLQLQGRAGSRQVKNANIALTHNQSNAPGSITCNVCIFGKPS